MNYDSPFDESQPSVKLIIPGASEFSATVTNDVSTKFPSVGEFTNTRTQPAIILEWKQSNCNWCGLLQFGDYDLNHSQFFNMGLRRRTQSFRGFADIGIDARDRKYLFSSRRSMRWHGAIQGEYAFSSRHALLLSAEGFHMFARGLPGESQIANKPGEVDHNLWQASAAYFWSMPNPTWRYFADIRSSAAHFYDVYPTGGLALKRQISLGCGVITVLKD
jgi:hypothetical protein